jgi:hypothetical protein
MIFGTSVPSFSGIKEKEETKETNIISEKESTEGFVSGEKIEKEISKLRNSEKAVTTTSQLTSIRTLKATGTTEEIGKRKSAVARAVGIGVDTLIEDHKDKERFYKGFSSKKDISEFVYITERYELSDEQVKYIAYATEKNYEELKEIFAMYEKDESLELPYFLLNKGIEERIEKAKVTTTSATKLRLEEIVEDVIYDENGKIIYKRGMETQEKSEETTTTSSTKLMTTNELSLKSTSTRSGLTMDLQNLQQYVKPLTSVSNGEGIAIDRETGNLTFSFDVGEMTYRDGLSEQLTLSYRLDDAASQQPYFNTNTRRHTQGSMSDTIRAFGIGAGWRLNLSFFINENDGLPSSGRGYLDAYKETLVDRVYLYDGRVVGVKQDENSDNIYEVEGEENKDLKFEVCDTAGEIYEFENGQTGEMPWSNLVKGYFIGMPSFKMVHKDGLVEYFNYKGQYLGKRDRNGNGYIVRYQKISHGGNLVKFFPSAVISNLGEKITLNLTGNKYGVSTIEQGNKVTEIQSTVEDSIWVGKSVKQKDKNNPSTSRTYTYTYQCYSSQFSFLTSLGHSGVDTAIPVEVVFPTGAKAIIDCYDYRVHIKDPETGNMTNGYVSKYGFSDIKFQNPSTGEIYNHETMDYETYLTQTVNNKNGIETTNDFNGEYLLGYKTLRENNKIIEKYSYWYTGSKDIRERTYTGYGLNTSEQRVTEETMTYSDNRNLLTYTDKIGVLHKYTYDATYNKCIKEETYKNNVLLKKIERTLDNKGNVTEEKEEQLEQRHQIDMIQKVVEFPT